MGSLFLGTSSWSEPGWRGVFYPRGLAQRQWLSHYATRFPVVEADVTYYRVPDPAFTGGWVERTPDGFKIAAKFPRSIVHGGDGPRPDPSVVLVEDRVARDRDAFLEAMGVLGPRCGPLLLQFPHFPREVFAGPFLFLERLQDFLSGLPKHFTYAVEVRNAAWVDPTLLEILRSHRVAFVLTDLRGMPHPDRFAATLDVLTADFLYGRLIGDRKAVDALTTRFDREVLDPTARLERWRRLLRELLPRVREAFVFTNNHYAGHAPATVARLASMMESPE